MFCSKTGPSLQAQEPRLQFCWRQVFHRKLRNQGCSFTRNWIGAVASHCLPHPTLSVASEQTWKDPRGINVEVRRVDLAKWALRNSPQGLNISSIIIFDQIRDPEIPITLRLLYIYINRRFCPREGLSLQEQETRLQFCPKCTSSTANSESSLQFHIRMNWCGSFPLISALHSLFIIWTDLKHQKRSQGHRRRGKESGFG